MKKLLIIVGICLLIVVPTSTAVPMKVAQPDSVIPQTTQGYFDNETPPDWATGNFSGIWGLNLLGQPLPPAGWVAGYYSFNGLVGRFEGVFDVFNETNATGAIGGFFLGWFMFGRIMNVSTGNWTGFVGIGGANTTHFYWRIMGIVGPTFYMYGTHAALQNVTKRQRFEERVIFP